MRLRVVERTDQPLRRQAAPPRARPARRPGERHEPLGLDADGAGALRRLAACAGLPVDLAATLLIEARMSLDWLEALSRDVSLLAYEPEPVALSAAEADYLRALTVGRALGRAVPHVDDGPTTIVLPVRLVARAAPEVVRRAVEGDLEQAIAMEVRALRGGMLMGEWAARAAAVA
jgi:hypothetical protein